jgi:hypothetical protein
MGIELVEATVNSIWNGDSPSGNKLWIYIVEVIVCLQHCCTSSVNRLEYDRPSIAACMTIVKL